MWIDNVEMFVGISTRRVGTKIEGVVENSHVLLRRN